MDAKELVIGGYYQSGIEITGSLSARLNLKSDGIIRLTKEHVVILCLNEQWLNFIHPILITNEHLFRMGFEIEYQSKNLTTLTLHSHNKVWRYSFWDTHKSFEVRGVELPFYLVESVHLFQNLFKALTGEEIKY